MEYYNKYLKYKQKYLSLKKDINVQGGSIKQKYLSLKKDINVQGGSIKQKYLSLKKDINHSHVGGNGCKSGCPKVEDLVCSRCKFKKYCSTECQIDDWPRHRIYCKPIKIINDNIAEIIKIESDLYKELNSKFVLEGHEKKIRDLAVIAIKSSYDILNKKFDYTKKVLDHTKTKLIANTPAYEYYFPNWYRFPLNPTLPSIKIDPTENNNFYLNSRDIPVPLFNRKIDLTFSSIPNDITLHMECTTAFYMTQFAILEKTMPKFLETLLDICVIDEIVERLLINGEKLPKGYDSIYEIAHLKNFITDGTLISEYFNEINNILLNEKKARRLFVIIEYLKIFFDNLSSKKNQFVKIGDGCLIAGHPKYESTWGSYSNENVYCIGHNDAGLPLFIGFSGNGKNTQDNTNICIPQTLNHIRRCLADEYIKSLNEEEPSTISQVPEENHINYLKAYLEIIKKPVRITGSIDIIQFNEIEMIKALPAPKEVSQEEIDNQQSYITCDELFKILNKN